MKKESRTIIFDKELNIEAYTCDAKISKPFSQTLCHWIY